MIIFFYRAKNNNFYLSWDTFVSYTPFFHSELLSPGLSRPANEALLAENRNRDNTKRQQKW